MVDLCCWSHSSLSDSIVAPIASFIVLSLFRAEKSVIIREATLDNYVNFFSNWTYAGTYLGTLALCFQVIAVSVILGYPIAWFIWQQRGSRRYLLLLLAVVPLFMSYIVKLYTLRSMLGLNGLVNQLLLGIGVIDKPSQIFLFNQRAVLITMVVIYLPFVILPIFLALERIPQVAAERLDRPRRERLGHVPPDRLAALAARHHRRRALCLRAGAGRLHHAADGRWHHGIHHRAGDLFAIRPCLRLALRRRHGSHSAWSLRWPGSFWPASPSAGSAYDDAGSGQNLAVWLTGTLTVIVFALLYAPVFISMLFSLVEIRQGKILWETLSFSPYVTLWSNTSVTDALPNTAIVAIVSVLVASCAGRHPGPLHRMGGRDRAKGARTHHLPALPPAAHRDRTGAARRFGGDRAEPRPRQPWSSATRSSCWRWPTAWC